MPDALHRRIGQLAVVGFGGPTVPPELVSLAREFDLGGVILFARNVESPEQVAEVACDVQQLARDIPPWVSVDQEGGRVARLRRPFTEWPPMSALGRSGDPALAGRFARVLATELRAVGISLDFAPVLDVLTNAANRVIGDRAISGRAETVSALGAVVVQMLEARGVAACGKHFPGHGDTVADSHDDLPVVDHPSDRLQEVEFLPFRAAIDAGVTAIMTAHVLVPALDARHPATLSPAIVQGLLRADLRFDGLVFTDDLDMKAVSARMTRTQAAVAAIGAGCDVALLCGPDCGAHAAVLEALVHAVEREELPYVRCAEALDRQRRAKARCAARGSGEGASPGALSPLDRAWRPPRPEHLRALLGCLAHQAVAEELSGWL
jgi:beta-N-acetylhexosaminidase